jgi:transcriptional regulator with XRE-family HTH domain
MKKISSSITKDGEETEVEIRAEVGKRIAEMRKKLGLSARRVAEELHISREAVTHIETGRNNISAVSLWKIATLFQCDIGDFFPDVPDGYALTRVDTNKVEQEAGEKAARWARELFAKTRIKKT